MHRRDVSMHMKQKITKEFQNLLKQGPFNF
jgi:hypothetical protein